MPIHDWTRVTAGIFHDFHHSWIEEIKRALNAGLLPSDYYALAEQIAGSFGPDILALQEVEANGPEDTPSSAPTGTNGVAVAVMPPRARFVATTEMAEYALKKSTVVVRHSSGDRVVALVEVVSPGNKSSRYGIKTFVEKAASALYRGYHLLVLDLLPPGPRDPQGIHGALWENIADASYLQPPDKPLTLAAYDAGPPKTAYVEPVAVGETLPDRPLFFQPGVYVSIPLDATYRAAFNGVPARWRRVLEAPGQ